MWEARPEEKAMGGKPAVIQAIEAGDLEGLRAMLAEDRSLALLRDENGVSPVMQALYRRRKEMLDLLLAAVPQLDIFESTSTGRIERVAELLRVDPGLATNWSGDGFSALHFACFFGQESIAIFLLQHGADAAAVARNSTRVTPLHSAAAARDLALVRTLLEHGAPPNARQQQGWTALHSAAQNGDRAMIDLLLQWGADRSLASDDGVTPTALASTNGHAQIARLLE
jgi:ankyrin repeat protein